MEKTRNLAPVKSCNIRDIVQGGRKTSMRTEDATVGQCSQRERIKQVHEIPPHVRVAILPEALVIKPIHLSNLTGLVVSADHLNPLRVSDFVAHQKSDALQGKISTINVVSEEQEICLWQIACYPEKLLKIVKLT